MNLTNIAKSISDHSNELTAKLIHYVGLPASGVGVATGVKNNTYTSKLLSPELWTPADFAAIAGGLASVFLIIQIVANLYFSIQERRLKMKRMQRNEDEKLTELGDKIIEEIARRQEKK